MSTVIALPAMAVILRSAFSTDPTDSQLCGSPLRTSVSMRMKDTHLAVTGRPTSTSSPTLKAAGLSTVKLVAPAAT
jgi:hypothetical protein